MKTNITGICKVIFAAFFLMVLMTSILLISFAEPSPECKDGDHIYSVTITREPTDTEDGERTYTCDVCGYTYTTPIPARGHKWSEWITDKEPTCSAVGHRYRVCTKYPDSPHTQEETIPATGEHNYAGKITKEPTCEDEGTETFTCTICGSVYTEQLPALGHNFGEWITDANPTKKKEGHRYRVCANDPTHTEEEIIPVLSSSVEISAENTSTNKINIMDIVLSVGFVGMMSGFGCAIYSDLHLIFWMKKKHKDYVNKMSAEQDDL